MIFTREDPLDETSSPAESELHLLMGGGIRSGGSSVVLGAGGSCLDVAEGSSLGIPEDDDLIGSDVSIGKDDCM